MAATFNWSVPTLERKLDDGFVFTAHWRCTATDGEYSASSYGTAGFTQDPEAAGFVPYEDLTEESFADKIEVVGDFAHVQVRTATVIKRDGEEISRSFHRHVVAPGDDYSAEDAKVQAVCAAVHTQEVIDAYMEAQANG